MGDGNTGSVHGFNIDQGTLGCAIHAAPAEEKAVPQWVRKGCGVNLKGGVEIAGKDLSRLVGKRPQGSHDRPADVDHRVAGFKGSESSRQPTATMSAVSGGRVCGC